jgi:hypothetical protein
VGCIDAGQRVLRTCRLKFGGQFFLREIATGDEKDTAVFPC